VQVVSTLICTAGCALAGARLALALALGPPVDRSALCLYIDVASHIAFFALAFVWGLRVEGLRAVLGVPPAVQLVLLVAAATGVSMGRLFYAMERVVDEGRIHLGDLMDVLTFGTTAFLLVLELELLRHRPWTPRADGAGAEGAWRSCCVGPRARGTRERVGRRLIMSSSVACGGQVGMSQPRRCW
jgi:hypothetical protein